MALSMQFPEFEVGRIEELSDSGSHSDDCGETPDHSLPNSEPESESTIAGEQYDGNAYDSDNSSHIAAEASDLEGNSTNSGDRTVSQTIVGRSHEPNHPEPGTDNPLKHNDAAATNMNNSTSNENQTQPVRNPRKPETRRLKKPLLAETRTKRGRVRKITWKMKEILRNVSMIRMLALMKMTQKAQELYHRSELYWSLHLWLDAHRLRNILQVLKKKDGWQLHRRS